MPPADRTPPHDLDSERALLGAMLLYDGARDQGVIDWDLAEVRAIVRPEAFCLPDHQTVFKAVLHADDAGEPIDLVNMSQCLRAAGPCDGGDWQGYVVELSESVPATANAVYYARQVCRAWQKREIIRSAQEAQSEAYEADSDPADIIASLVNHLDKINQASQADREAQPEASLLRSLQNPRNVNHNKVPVTFGQLGRILDGGLERGTLTVIGARPSCGKTSLGLGLCVHASRATDGFPSLFVSCEMTAEQVAVRLPSLRSTLPIRRIRSGDVDDVAFNSARNKAALDAEQGHPIFVLDGTRDARAIAAHVCRHVRRHGVALVVVDYLGLCDIAGTYDRYDLKIGAMSALFKSLAHETSTAIVMAEQLSRASDRESRRPRISDLRDSGKIEADADNIILVQKGKDDTAPVCDTWLIVAKQRQGEIGDALVCYHKATMSYAAKCTGTETETMKQQTFPSGDRLAWSQA